ncbi:hypothetical protein AB0O90_04860 [Microbacterium testaceum]|uniref:hypothetical protein n=1 Tax=Microbacterium testaceum TaxID=2033 RepID=UPI0034417701
MTVRKISTADARLRRLAHDLRVALEQQPREHVTAVITSSLGDVHGSGFPPMEGPAEVTVCVGSAREAQELARRVKASNNTVAIQYGVKRA